MSVSQSYLVTMTDIVNKLRNRKVIMRQDIKEVVFIIYKEINLLSYIQRNKSSESFLEYLYEINGE